MQNSCSADIIGAGEDRNAMIFTIQYSLLN